MPQKKQLAKTDWRVRVVYVAAENDLRAVRRVTGKKSDVSIPDSCLVTAVGIHSVDFRKSESVSRDAFAFAKKQYRQIAALRVRRRKSGKQKRR